MSTIEQVEKLKEKANVSYEEAKIALEAASGDMLDAIIYLERQGKVSPPENDGRVVVTPHVEEAHRESTQNQSEHIETFSSLVKKFFRMCGRVIQKGNSCMFEVRRYDKIIMSVPLTVLAVLLFFAFWIVIPLIIVGLFCNYRYSFRGTAIENTGVNKAFDAAANAAESIKKELQ